MTSLIASLSWIDSIAGFVWVVLSVFMIIVLRKINKTEGVAHPSFALGLLLFIMVWLYPLATFFFNWLELGALGNVVILTVTVIHALRVSKRWPKLARWLIPQVIWLAVATFYVGAMIYDKYTS